MSDATPIDDALDGLSRLAACDLRLAERFAARIEALPEDADDRANSLARSYQRVARSYRQSVAMQLRVRRELRAEAKADADAAHRSAARHASAPRPYADEDALDAMAELDDAVTARIRAEYDPSEAEAIEGELEDAINEIWATEGFADLPLDDQVDALMVEIRKAFKPAPEPAPPIKLFNGRLAPPMDLPSWRDEDSS